MICEVLKFKRLENDTIEKYRIGFIFNKKKENKNQFNKT